MAAPADTADRSRDDLIQALAELVTHGSPAIAGFAKWALDHPEEMAFHSVRGLSDLSGANVNTVYRLSIALGFSGFEDCRRAFQSALRRVGGLYGARATRLSAHTDDVRMQSLRDSAHGNIDALFTDDNIARIKQASALLLQARRIHCIGVRSCFALAHYFSYTGSMAFPNFERSLTEPGSIADRLAHAGPEEVIVLITFSLYSAEVVRAHEAALAKGLPVIAVTDSYTSPIARRAKLVFCLPMEGPQPLPSHGAGFALVEAIVAEMIAANAEAPKRIANFERQLLQLGSYVSGGEP